VTTPNRPETASGRQNISIVGLQDLTPFLRFVFAIAVVCSWFAQKHPKWGVRILPLVGVLLAAVLVWRLLVVPVGGEQLDVWPVLLGGAGFFYLWWLAALLFDLIFVWHHYVRSAAVADHLREHMKEVHDTTAPANG